MASSTISPNDAAAAEDLMRQFRGKRIPLSRAPQTIEDLRALTGYQRQCLLDALSLEEMYRSVHAAELWSLPEEEQLELLLTEIRYHRRAGPSPLMKKYLSDGLEADTNTRNP